jgi:hypothetical protein
MYGSVMIQTSVEETGSAKIGRKYDDRWWGRVVDD